MIGIVLGGLDVVPPANVAVRVVQWAYEFDKAHELTLFNMDADYFDTIYSFTLAKVKQENLKRPA